MDPLMVTKPPVSDFVTARLVRLIAWTFELFTEDRFLPREKYGNQTLLLLNLALIYSFTFLCSRAVA